MNLSIRPAFWLDLEKHHYWLTTRVSEAIADRWIEAIWRTVEFLHSQPQLGRVRQDLKHPGVRSWLVNGFRRWTIFYGLQDEYLVLYRVEGGETNLRGLVIG